MTVDELIEKLEEFGGHLEVRMLVHPDRPTLPLGAVVDDESQDGEIVVVLEVPL